MATRRRTATAADLLDSLAATAPQVVAMRMASLATAGMSPSTAQRREMQRMVMEKWAAFGTAWHAMAWAGVAQFNAAAWSMWMAPWTGKASLPASDAFDAVLRAGLAPIHAAARSNATRLRRRG